jgi:hypothetical protein
MSNPNPTYYQQRRQPGQIAAFLLGAGPMLPPTQQENAVAMANRALDNPTPGPVDTYNDENIDPQLRTQHTPQGNQPQSKSYDIVQ